jgi:hypothetical protein
MSSCRSHGTGRRAGTTVAAALALLALVVIAGCGHGGPLRVDLEPDVRRPAPGVVILLVDGLAAGTVERGCREGWLPNIKARFREQGLRVEHATACVPTITYAAITTLMTGVGPGRHQITGNAWFDPLKSMFREYRLIRTYDWVDQDHDFPLIYELIQPAASAVIQTVHRRGATRIYDNWAVSGVMWYFKDYTAVDKLTASTVDRVARWANRRGEWPTLLTCYFPGLDSIGHRFGISSERFRAAAEHVDHQIGRICDWLERQGLLETTYVVLVADHGMVDVRPEGHVDLARLLVERWGRNLAREERQDGPRREREAYFARFDTVIADRGRAAFIHFRGADGWRRPPTPGAVEQILCSPTCGEPLWDIPGVDLLAYKADGEKVALRSRRGRAYIRRTGVGRRSQYAYVPDPDDVLGYLHDDDVREFVAAGAHPSRAWLQPTGGQEYPDLVPRLFELMQTRRAGQVAVFAEPGYSFVRERGGHGGVCKEEMLIPLMIAGPGVVPGSTIDAARAEDLVPTLLDLLNVEVDEDLCLEGVSLLRAGAPAEPGDGMAP